jgi:hypothetical protein
LTLDTTTLYSYDNYVTKNTSGFNNQYLVTLYAIYTFDMKCISVVLFLLFCLFESYQHTLIPPVKLSLWRTTPWRHIGEMQSLYEGEWLACSLVVLSPRRSIYSGHWTGNLVGHKSSFHTMAKRETYQSFLELNIRYSVHNLLLYWLKNPKVHWMSL